MNFRIVTTASYDYAPVVDFCLPSWRKNSGADEITVRWHERRDRDGNRRWFRAVQERCRTIRDAVHVAVADKAKLLLLDADCLVLRNLTEGFATGKAIGMARWPRINMGVIFLNTDMDWPFCDLFDEYLDRSLAHIDQLIAERSQRCGADQTVFTAMLQDHDEDVAKLDKEIWNMAFSERMERKDILGHRDHMRIFHLRIATSFRGEVERFDFLRETFAGLL